MTRWILQTMCAVALTSAIGCSTATAATITVSPPNSADAATYQRWLDKARVPIPNVGLTIIQSAATCEVRIGACTDGTTVWISPTANRITFLHEIGHVWDIWEMRPWQRHRFKGLLGIHRRWVDPDAVEEPQETWAEAYAQCATRSRFSAGEVLVGAMFRSGRKLNAVCRMIRKTSR